MNLPPLPAADRIMWQYGQQIDHYSPEQMRAYAAEAVRVALEEAAQLVQANALACADGSMLQVYLASNAAAVLALKDKP